MTLSVTPPRSKVTTSFRNNEVGIYTLAKLLTNSSKNFSLYISGNHRQAFHTNN